MNQFVVQAALNVPLSDYLLRIPQAYAAATKNQKAAALLEKAFRLKTAADARPSTTPGYAPNYKSSWARKRSSSPRHTSTMPSTPSRPARPRGRRAAQRKPGGDQQTGARAHAQLNQIGRDPDPRRHARSRQATYEVGETVDAEIAPPDAPANVSDMWAEAKAHRLEARAFDESAGSFRQQAKGARAASYPKLDAFGNLYVSNPNQRIVPAQAGFAATWDVGLQLSWSPNDWSQGAASANSLEARASNLVSQRQAWEDGMRVEVTQANNVMIEARAAIESTAYGLAAAEESYRVRRSLFQNGRATKSSSLMQRRISRSRASRPSTPGSISVSPRCG